ncbi:protein of unknown function [Methylocaldum szegediense]|uniref:Uncharacterized protein n=1 Tax=Methylocaldum szegediense TaxID=73780 RepID=A0ABM9HWK0_9GAMM|nr:hypothetical protein [Methylocaldum szegediense]CAI8734294.1 protein of unknown function [Methylocaldum szegediense]
MQKLKQQLVQPDKFKGKAARRILKAVALVQGDYASAAKTGGMADNERRPAITVVNRRPRIFDQTLRMRPLRVFKFHSYLEAKPLFSRKSQLQWNFSYYRRSVKVAKIWILFYQDILESAPSLEFDKFGLACRDRY